MKFMQIKPQKARGKFDESMWTDPNWSAEEKFDGDRRIAQFVNGVVRFTGTRESVDGTGFVEKTMNLPHLAGMIGYGGQGQEIGKLQGTVLDGEIIFTGKTDGGGLSKYVTSIMGSSPDEAIRKQKERGWLEYAVFDCLWYKGEDLRNESLEVRREHVEAALELWDNEHAWAVGHGTTDKEAYFDTILKRGGEGVILKHRDHTYGNEKLWVKVKGEWTADVIVSGFTEGKGKYKGQIGAIKMGQHKGKMAKGCLSIDHDADQGLYSDLLDVGQCSGMDDALRAEITSHSNKFIGRVMEIKHNGREPTGKFRHPRFKRWRDDKKASDCIYRKDEI